MSEPPEHDQARFVPPVAPPDAGAPGARRPMPSGPPTYVLPGPGVAPEPRSGPTVLPTPPAARRRRHVGGGTIAVLATVTVVVAVLIGYVVAGLREGPQEPYRIGAADLPATTADRTAGASSTVPSTTSPSIPTTTADGAGVGATPRDADGFCRAGRAVTAFEARFAAAEAGDRFPLLAGFVVQEREAWDRNVRALAAAAPPDSTGDVFQYVLVHRALFDAVQASSSYDELRARVDLAVVASASTWADRIGAAVEANCP